MDKPILVLEEIVFNSGLKDTFNFYGVELEVCKAAFDFICHISIHTVSNPESDTVKVSESIDDYSKHYYGFGTRSRVYLPIGIENGWETLITVYLPLWYFTKYINYLKLTKFNPEDHKMYLPHDHSRHE